MTEATLEKAPRLSFTSKEISHITRVWHGLEHGDPENSLDEALQQIADAIPKFGGNPAAAKRKLIALDLLGETPKRVSLDEDELGALDRAFDNLHDVLALDDNPERARAFYKAARANLARRYAKASPATETVPEGEGELRSPFPSDNE